MLLDVPLDAEPELIVYGKLASGSWSWYAWWPRPPDSAFMLYFFFNLVCQLGGHQVAFMQPVMDFFCSLCCEV